jgi:hypothetical protein
VGLPRSAVVLALFLLQIALLLIGIGREYELKHEDNNALHATFARSHLELGLQKTRGQNHFYSPSTGDLQVYAHHPPAPALTLAVVYRITGRDGPAVTRATAVGFHVLATWLFYCFMRRVFERDQEVFLATFLFVVVPESTFFGRMMNHEVLVLPAAILLVRGYWESIRDGWSTPRWVTAVLVGAVWAALSGWAGFFSIGACVAHAGWEVVVRRNPRAQRALIVLSVVGCALFALDVAHAIWVLGGDAAYLREVLESRMGSDDPLGLGRWFSRVVELHWRYFGLTSLFAVAALAYRGLRALRIDGASDPAVDVGSLFFLAGAGYVAIFNHNAQLHDYWQFLLLPASAIALTLTYRWILEGLGSGRRRSAWLALVTVVTLDISATAIYTLQERHLHTEAYCEETVAVFRRDFL